MAETHVVTVALGFCDMPPFMVEMFEIFRGNERECRQLSALIPGCSHDRRAIHSVDVSYGPIVEWERHVKLFAFPHRT